MDVGNIFHMTGGSGSTSYANNSSFQMKASDTVKHITVETIEQLYLQLESFPKTIGIADMGCSSGRNSLPVIKTIVESVEEIGRRLLAEPPDEFSVYLNDLPSNDFNSVFKALPDFIRQLREERNGRCPSIFIAGCPGSFYGRLLPKNSMHFVYSSYCLHWLSKVPPSLCNEKGESLNKGNLYISESSPPAVSLAYFLQFQDDFSMFLRSRSKELVCKGRMLLILLGRVDQDNHVDRGNSFLWELLSRSLTILASQGKLNKEKLDCYHAHFYAPSKCELEDQVRREGSFVLDRFKIYQLEKTCNGTNYRSYGFGVAMTVRAAQEVMLRHHFGLEVDGILDTLFEIYGNMVDEEMAKEEIEPFTFLLVLRKL
ncbi:hypothetical protein EZV62_019658 [Acer yangbiense]|uniref:Uncharacterized protein n=1 Tax=Acer yangbiense TaxID=1000413 RepID=A0A5C7HD53_9ROSI|nr:hypothetical protein EZV62_019658 [Acer yangbiense]